MNDGRPYDCGLVVPAVVPEPVGKGEPVALLAAIGSDDVEDGGEVGHCSGRLLNFGCGCGLIPPCKGAQPRQSAQFLNGACVCAPRHIFRMGAMKIKKPAKATVDALAAKSKPALNLTRRSMIELYATNALLPHAVQVETGLRMPVEVYFKDPGVVSEGEVGIDDEFTTPWEPGLRDGPTSARFAVVDYDATTNTLTSPAVWDGKQNCYLAPDGTRLDRNALSLFQFHQLCVWAMVQNTLDFFERGFGLGRRITWAFEGNRLIVVPHAGYGANAYYDRASKSLQFYYFEGPHGIVYTCLSSDIVNHEFGHALLDGLRPHFYESVAGEAAAFHEFVGDLTAILMAFDKHAVRHRVLEEGQGSLDNDNMLSNLAGEFGEAVTGTAYLRSALNTKTMEDLAGNLEPHALSEVLTGAMFDILRGIYAKQLERSTPAMALAQTVNLVQTIAIQPLDLLPPCAVTFRDYVLAVVRTEQFVNPTDPTKRGYLLMMLDIFVRRGILSAQEKEKLLEPAPVVTRMALDVFHPLESIAASRGGAYRFLDDNRKKLFIPRNADLVVSEVVRARKVARDGRQLPDQVVVQYVWREEALLDGRRFGRFANERVSILCGATLVLDQNGNQIHWSRKPGSAAIGDREGQVAEETKGAHRRAELLDAIAARIAAGMIGEAPGGELGMVQRAAPPFGVSRIDGTLRFQLAPHFSIIENADESEVGDRQWQISF
jgi:hypothetical protein